MTNKIIIEDNAININNNNFNMSLAINNITKIFGTGIIQKTKAKEAKSTIHTFNEYGAWVYEEKGIVNQISLLLTEPYLYFHPKNKFDGDIIINGKNINTANDFLEVKCDEIWLDEWEAEGAVALKLGNVACNMSASNSSKEIEDIDFWFIN